MIKNNLQKSRPYFQKDFLVHKKNVVELDKIYLSDITILSAVDSMLSQFPLNLKQTPSILIEIVNKSSYQDLYKMMKSINLDMIEVYSNKLTRTRFKNIEDALISAGINTISDERLEYANILENMRYINSVIFSPEIMNLLTQKENNVNEKIDFIFNALLKKYETALKATGLDYNFPIKLKSENYCLNITPESLNNIRKKVTSKIQKRLLTSEVGELKNFNVTLGNILTEINLEQEI